MKKILVSSSKGGVGKSTISACIARELHSLGYNVGILDIDIDCPNIPEFMNMVERDMVLSDRGIIPKLVDGIEVMSIGLLAENGTAVLWSAERRSMAIEQMMNKVDWTCDVLIIDSPPGTSEELSTIISKFSPDGILLITTGHKASIADVKRELTMIKLLKASKKIIGIAKNMTLYICPNCGNKSNIFNSEEDEEIDSMVIAEIPLLDDKEQILEYLKPIIDKIEKVI